MEMIIIATVGIGVGILQGLIIYILNGQTKKLDSVCKDNREDHKTLFTAIAGHEHRITVVEERTT